MRDHVISKIPAEIITSSLLAMRIPASLAILFTQNDLPKKIDANPVLLIPGLGASDVSMYWLQLNLQRSGYQVYGSGLLRNEGSFQKQGEQLRERISRISEETGKPVDIVGWSMGGRYAVHLSNTNPDEVGKVITLGSPLINYNLAPNREQAWVVALTVANISIEDLRREMQSDCRIPDANHPLSAIIGTYDAVVEARGSVLPEALLIKNTHIENIYVGTGHIGLGLSRRVLQIAIDRLDQPVHLWQTYLSRIQ